MQRFDTRYVAFTGLMIFAYSCFMNTAMSPDYAGDQLWILNIVRAIGQATVLTPLTSVMTGGIAPAGCCRGIGHQQHAFATLAALIGTAVLATVITSANSSTQHRPVGHAGSRGGTQPDRANDEPFWRTMVCRIPGSGASAGHRCSWQSRETPGAGDGLQRHTFAVIGTVLVLAAIAVAFTRKVKDPEPEPTRGRHNQFQRKVVARDLIMSRAC